MKKLSLYLFVIAALVTCVSTVAHAQPYYIKEAFRQAYLPSDAKGDWGVRADVNLHKPDGTIIEGSGNLDLNGNNGNVLDGNLALKKAGGNMPGQTMYIYILNAQPLTVRVRHDIAGKPFLGRPADVVRLEDLSYRTPFSRGKVNWDGEECTISIFLTPGQTKMATGPKPIPGAPPADPKNLPGIIHGGTTLIKNNHYRSTNKLYSLVCQSDGNLVLYRQNTEALWNTRTYGVVTTCEFQKDGNLVIYYKGSGGWNSRKDAATKNESWLDYLPPYGIDSTSKASAAQYWLAVQNDGNLVIYAGTYPKGNAIWASGTVQLRFK